MGAVVAKLLGFVAPYLLLVAAVAAIAGGGLALWYRDEAHDAATARDKATGELAQATVVNRAQAQTITELKAQAQKNDAIVAQLAEDIAGIHSEISEETKARNDLDRDNADVHAYLGTPAPAALVELYNKRAAAPAGAAAHKGKSAGRAP
jgi:LysB family phage lysis regulatory protein